MALLLPVNKIPAEALSLNNTQWCSWASFHHDNDIYLQILTFKDGKVYEMSTTNHIIADEIPDSSYTIEDQAESSSKINMKYGYSLDSNYIKTSSETPGLTNIKETYLAAKDMNNQTVLIKTGSYGEKRFSTIYPPGAVYFKCDDPRPLSKSPSLTKFLPILFSKQMEKLSK